MPTIDINKAAAEVNSALSELNDALRDAAYVAVGFGVLGFQRAQVRRVELTKQLESQLGSLGSLPAVVSAQASDLARTAREQTGGVRGQLVEQLDTVTKSFEDQIESMRKDAADLAKSFEERIQPVRRQVEEQLDRLEETLPPPARGVVQSLRTAAAAQEQLLRGVAGTN